MPPRRPSTLRLAVADAATTAAFILFSSLWGEAALRLAPATGMSAFVAGLAVLGVGLAAFSPAARAIGRLAGVGGAPCFNPAHALALAAAGKGLGGPVKAALARGAAQTAGAVGGAVAATALLPLHLAATVPLPAMLSLRSAVVAETLLGAALALVVIWSVAEARPGSWGAWGVPLACTLAFTWAGSLGNHVPSFNPAYAAAWARKALAASASHHTALAHAGAFLVAPMVGALLAGGIWRAVEEPPKKAKKNEAAVAARARSAAAAKAKGGTKKAK
jgi:hypothetical protein